MNGICFKTGLGHVSIREEGNKITNIGFEEKDFLNEPTDLLLRAKEEITQYLNGERLDFDLPLELKGTDFQRSVWKALEEIKFGETVSYSHIASMIGNPKAVRAVGGAIGSNPIAIIVPCHRILGKDGSITGYYYGTDIKKELLKIEGINVF